MSCGTGNAIADIKYYFSKMEGHMFDMKAISPAQFDAWDNSPPHWKRDQEDLLASNSAGFQYWEEDGLSEGCCFDIYAWSMVS